MLWSKKIELGFWDSKVDFGQLLTKKSIVD